MRGFPFSAARPASTASSDLQKSPSDPEDDRLRRRSKKLCALVDDEAHASMPPTPRLDKYTGHPKPFSGDAGFLPAFSPALLPRFAHHKCADVPFAASPRRLCARRDSNEISSTASNRK